MNLVFFIQLSKTRVSEFIWKSRQNKDNRNLSGVSIDHEYILCYSKSFGNRYLKGSERKTEQYNNPDNDPRGPWASANMAGLLPEDQRPNCHYDLINPKSGINYGKPKMGWRYDKTTMAKLISEDRIIWPESSEGRPRKKSFLSEISEVLPGYSSMVGNELYTRTATLELEKLLDKRYFDYPKPLELIYDFIEQTTINNDIILDFFSGSATTAHAVMQLNAEDGGNRKFICVQLPEVTDEKSEAFKAGYKNICEIGKERIRRAGKKLTDTDGQTTLDDEKNLDIGFKVFKLDTSNLLEWDGTPIPEHNQLEFANRLNKMIDSIKSERTDMDVVYEIILKMGYALDTAVSYVEIGDKIAYVVGEMSLIVCLCNGITAEDIEKLADFKPEKIVMSDSCFADSVVMSNAFYILRDRGVELKLV